MTPQRSLAGLGLLAILAALGGCGTIDNCTKGMNPPPMGWTTPGHTQP